MIIFEDNVISVLSEVIEGKDISVTEDLDSIDTSAPEDLEAADSSVPEDFEAEYSSVSEDSEVKNTSTSAQQSATGETQQTVVPNIVNDIVIPDNSYSKYCFFFLMLLFALFVGRSFRKGV